MRSSTRLDPDFEGAISWALQLLREQLPAQLTYHNLAHTQQDVLPAAERLAGLCHVNGQARQLLRVAAAFHDLGFIEHRQEHEIASARLAAQNLPAFHFTSQQIDAVMGMILATRLPQAPRNLLEEILADADLDTLGRPDFFERSHALRQELIFYQGPIPWREWYTRQRQFLIDHSYFTEAARSLRQAYKQVLIIELEMRIDALQPTP